MHGSTKWLGNSSYSTAPARANTTFASPAPCGPITSGAAWNSRICSASIRPLSSTGVTPSAASRSTSASSLRIGRAALSVGPT
jgi:hypothetical protein